MSLVFGNFGLDKFIETLYYDEDWPPLRGRKICNRKFETGNGKYKPPRFFIGAMKKQVSKHSYGYAKRQVGYSICPNKLAKES